MVKMEGQECNHCPNGMREVASAKAAILTAWLRFIRKYSGEILNIFLQVFIPQLIKLPTIDSPANLFL